MKIGPLTVLQYPSLDLDEVNKSSAYDREFVFVPIGNSPKYFK